MDRPMTAVAELVEHCAAPATARVALDRLTERYPDLTDRLAGKPDLATAVVAVVASSRSLTRLLEVDPAGLKVLGGLDDQVLTGPDVETVADLVRWKRLEYLRIAARDLTGLDRLEATGAALARLAADVLDAACRLANAEGVAVVGMGKLGGAELNYASDIDLIFVSDDGEERVVRRVIETARQCFRVDLNLRPEGRDGVLARSLASYEAYWERWAQPWEFQALLKARPIAGDRKLGAAFARSSGERLWARPFDTDSIRSVRDMKARAETEVARKGIAEREIKRGPGGIRDIEFTVQLLQLVHGSADAALRSANTLDALAELADAGYVGRHDADDLTDAYRFLRLVEHRLQLVDEQRVHALPADPSLRDQLARVLGYRPHPTAMAVEQLDHDVRHRQTEVRAIHERIYFRPLLEAFARHEGAVMTEDAAKTRLAAFGFTDAERTRQAVVELTRGLTRSSRLMQQMLPLLLDWLSESPDPDLGLLGLRNLTAGPQRSMELANAFRESPEVARRLCHLLGTSSLVARQLARHPELIAQLGTPDELALRSRAELAAGTAAALTWRGDWEERRTGLKRFIDREWLRIAAHDVLDLIDAAEVGQALSSLAEAALDAALESVASSVPWAVVGMGRFGGGELAYASDLDVLFVYEGAGPTTDTPSGTASDFATVERCAEEVLRFFGGSPPIYAIDPNLRPEGRKGPLARSLEGYRVYFERWAQPWERLAMVRARPVAGDRELGAKLLDIVAPYVWRDGLADDDRREIRRVKARVERERIPPTEDAQFHLKLGRGSLSDVEFTAQLLQLEHGVWSPSTVDALDALVRAGALSPADHQVLTAAYRFCERTRNRRFLVNGFPSDSLPQQAERLTRLARSLGTRAQDLREDYRRVTRRARRVVERLFYGQE